MPTDLDINPDTVLSVASWAVEVGELSTAKQVLAFFEKPWHYPELYFGWETEETDE